MTACTLRLYAFTEPDLGTFDFKVAANRREFRLVVVMEVPLLSLVVRSRSCFGSVAEVVILLSRNSHEFGFANSTCQLKMDRALACGHALSDHGGEELT